MSRYPSSDLLWSKLIALVDGSHASTLQRAYHLAHRAHSGQSRDGSDEPYLNHPLRVALILTEEMGQDDPLLLSTALLHDVIEDSNVTREEILLACGPLVADCVVLLSKGVLEGEEKRARDDRYFGAIAAGPLECRLVKCADRLDNLRSMQKLGQPDRLARYLDETRRYILPIATETDDYLASSLRAICDGSA